MKIIADTVTYNSSKSLEKTIKALLSQTLDVYKIVIADNNSNEENKQNLRRIQKKYPDKIDIIWLKSNTGGAGGFYETMKYTKEKYNPDWYWLMDDDAYPNDNCLEKLLDNKNQLDNIGFLAPIIWGIDNSKFQLYHARVKKGFIYKFKPISNDISELPEISQIRVDAFVGPLISAKAVDECGFPRSEYFIEGDDTDYTFRITQKFNGYLIKSAQMNHRDIVFTQDINPKGWWKDYYWYRNSILFQIYNIHGIHKIIGLIYILLWSMKSRHLMFTNPKYRDYKEFRWGIMRKGIIDGIFMRSGANLLPSDYFRELDKWEKMKRGEYDR